MTLPANRIALLTADWPMRLLASLLSALFLTAPTVNGADPLHQVLVENGLDGLAAAYRERQLQHGSPAQREQIALAMLESTARAAAQTSSMDARQELWAHLAQQWDANSLPASSRVRELLTLEAALCDFLWWRWHGEEQTRTEHDRLVESWLQASSRREGPKGSGSADVSPVGMSIALARIRAALALAEAAADAERKEWAARAWNDFDALRNPGTDDFAWALLAAQIHRLAGDVDAARRALALGKPSNQAERDAALALRIGVELDSGRVHEALRLAYPRFQGQDLATSELEYLYARLLLTPWESIHGAPALTPDSPLAEPASGREFEVEPDLDPVQLAKRIALEDAVFARFARLREVRNDGWTNRLSRFLAERSVHLASSTPATVTLAGELLREAGQHHAAAALFENRLADPDLADESRRALRLQASRAYRLTNQPGRAAQLWQPQPIDPPPEHLGSGPGSEHTLTLTAEESLEAILAAIAEYRVAPTRARFDALLRRIEDHGGSWSELPSARKVALWKGILLALDRRPVEAIATLRAISSGHPNHAEALLAIGRIHDDWLRRDENATIAAAIAFHESIDPQSLAPKYRLELALLHAAVRLDPRSDHPEQAIAIVEPWLDVIRLEPDTISKVHTERIVATAGLAALRMGRFDLLERVIGQTGWDQSVSVQQHPMVEAVLWIWLAAITDAEPTSWGAAAASLEPILDRLRRMESSAPPSAVPATSNHDQGVRATTMLLACWDVARGTATTLRRGWDQLSRNEEAPDPRSALWAVRAGFTLGQRLEVKRRLDVAQKSLRRGSAEWLRLELERVRLLEIEGRREEALRRLDRMDILHGHSAPVSLREAIARQRTRLVSP